LAKAAVSGERGWDAEIHRLCGELTARSPHPDPAKAEESFRTALAIAREQGTRGYELRAATSLARLWGEQGRRGEARVLLAPVYGSFTEGFDTADLKEAKALLDELNSTALNAWPEWRASYQWLTRHPADPRDGRRAGRPGRGPGQPSKPWSPGFPLSRERRVERAASRATDAMPSTRRTTFF